MRQSSLNIIAGFTFTLGCRLTLQLIFNLNLHQTRRSGYCEQKRIRAQLNNLKCGRTPNTHWWFFRYRCFISLSLSEGTSAGSKTMHFVRKSKSNPPNTPLISPSPVRTFPSIPSPSPHNHKQDQQTPIIVQQIRSSGRDHRLVDSLLSPPNRKLQYTNSIRYQPPASKLPGWLADEFEQQGFQAL